jgi:hypothetical protein
MTLENIENLPESFFKLSRKELKVVKVLGLPKDMRQWTPDIVKGIYDSWEVKEKSGMEHAQIIDEDAIKAGVSSEIAHAVHQAVITVNLLQQGQEERKTKK